MQILQGMSESLSKLSDATASIAQNCATQTALLAHIVYAINTANQIERNMPAVYEASTEKGYKVFMYEPQAPVKPAETTAAVDEFMKRVRESS